MCILSVVGMLLFYLCFACLLTHFKDTNAATEEPITCASVIKLANNQDKSRLHSHDVKYGSGSQQQSVTGTNNFDDVNSHWQILGGSFFIFVACLDFYYMHLFI